MPWLKPLSIDEFMHVMQLNRHEHRWSGLTLTGAEITLDARLPELARIARNHGFTRIRIQTHGGRLADQAYLQQLIDSGINEFFISVTAANEELHDKITSVSGSFRNTIKALENISQYPELLVATNTVITAQSYKELPATVHLLSQYSCVRQVEYWYYFPMRSSDDKQLLVPVATVQPYLILAISLARQLGLEVEVKNYPECLLGVHAQHLYNDQPQLEIDSRFWEEFSRNGFYQCHYASTCASTSCLGLSTAYIERFGYESTCLKPLQSFHS
jgi:hypothetical protein